ncbi:MAG TPA: flagellar biosynthesis protein [Ideonella sp.]|uniref:flagellar biosynthesis protein n=1 Tax=Ideonella sp. TaxID=1929293 RepID=UPI002C9E25E4|nr:flagellar biosynthesis protein [Ideonella sp.]HSI52106.1 flagellar biosynthesis protein [Ideonella sp.]
MNAFTSSPSDQADGLRRLFSGQQVQIVPVVANPHVDMAAVMLERLSLAFAELGAHALVLDAADSSPLPNELIDMDLPSCIERLGDSVSYLAARGLPRRHVNSRGSSEAWLAAVEQAAPFAHVIIVHAEARDLCRLLGAREVCPVLMAGLESVSLTEAYAAMKLLSQRLGLMAFDLLVGMASRPRRAERVADRLSSCADNFLAAAMRNWAAVDRDIALNKPASPELSQLAEDQLTGLAAPSSFAPSPALAGQGASLSLD